MKKLIICLLLVLAVSLPIFAKGNLGIGAEVGYPSSGLTFAFDITEKVDGYVTLRFNYGSALEFAFGAEFKVAEFVLENSTDKINLNLGGQFVPTLVIGHNYSMFGMGFLGTLGLSYDFSDVTLYFRTGLGLGIAFSDGIHAKFDYHAALGFIYHL